MRLKISRKVVWPTDTGRCKEHVPLRRERASAMYSCNVWTGTEGCTTSITVLRVNSEIGAKSFNGS